MAPGAAGCQREVHHRHLGTSQWSVPERGREGGRKEERERIGRMEKGEEKGWEKGWGRERKGGRE